MPHRDDPQPGDYQIRLRPLPCVAPPARRLAQLLKFALRALNLKCIEAREVPAPPPPETDSNAKP